MKNCDTQHNNIKHNKYWFLCWVSQLSPVCSYAECPAECIMQNVIMQSVIMLSVIMLSVIMLSVMVLVIRD